MTPEQRSRAMSKVRQKDTPIEIALRSALHRRGLRFRKHVKGLPGTPDLVFTRAKVAVFIDGDFWHGYRFRHWRDKQKPFWRDKIEANRTRDCRNFRKLRGMGWRVIRVWEHDVKKNLPQAVARVEKAWLRGGGQSSSATNEFGPTASAPTSVTL